MKLFPIADEGLDGCSLAFKYKYKPQQNIQNVGPKILQIADEVLTDHRLTKLHAVGSFPEPLSTTVNLNLSPKRSKSKFALSPDHRITCDVCTHSPDQAEVRCEECEENLCSSHALKHATKKMTAAHTVKSIPCLDVPTERLKVANYSSQRVVVPYLNFRLSAPSSGWYFLMNMTSLYTERKIRRVW